MYFSCVSYIQTTQSETFKKRIIYGQKVLILMGKNYLFHKRRKSDRCLGIGQSYLREARAGMEIVCSLLYEVRKQKHPNWTLTSPSPMESAHEVRRHVPVQRFSQCAPEQEHQRHWALLKQMHILRPSPHLLSQKREHFNKTSR